jgi:hypothetical protein
VASIFLSWASPMEPSLPPPNFFSKRFEAFRVSRSKNPSTLPGLNPASFSSFSACLIVAALGGGAGAGGGVGSAGQTGSAQRQGGPEYAGLS